METACYLQSTLSGSVYHGPVIKRFQLTPVYLPLRQTESKDSVLRRIVLDTFTNKIFARADRFQMQTGLLSHPPTGLLSHPPTGLLSQSPTGLLSPSPTGLLSHPPTGLLSPSPTGLLTHSPSGVKQPPTGRFPPPPLYHTGSPSSSTPGTTKAANPLQTWDGVMRPKSATPTWNEKLSRGPLPCLQRSLTLVPFPKDTGASNQHAVTIERGAPSNRVLLPLLVIPSPPVNTPHEKKGINTEGLNREKQRPFGSHTPRPLSHRAFPPPAPPLNTHPPNGPVTDRRHARLTGTPPSLSWGRKGLEAPLPTFPNTLPKVTKQGGGKKSEQGGKQSDVPKILNITSADISKHPIANKTHSRDRVVKSLELPPPVPKFQNRDVPKLKLPGSFPHPSKVTRTPESDPRQIPTPHDTTLLPTLHDTRQLPTPHDTRQLQPPHHTISSYRSRDSPESPPSRGSCTQRSKHDGGFRGCDDEWIPPPLSRRIDPRVATMEDLRPVAPHSRTDRIHALVTPRVLPKYIAYPVGQPSQSYPVSPSKPFITDRPRMVQPLRISTSDAPPPPPTLLSLSNLQRLPLPQPQTPRVEMQVGSTRDSLGPPAYTVKRENDLNKFKLLASPIIPDKLYLSGGAVAADHRVLSSLGITHILNVAGDQADNHFTSRFKYLTLYLQDTRTTNEELESILFYAVEWIKGWIRSLGFQ
eukprot:GHVO01033235.1.p1 GENE.GHVO01033235.1~~GHVO01033235.1.p1  ORF type:complete len:714 (-),score=136.84 GHVO01033235.1:292-2379(-)